ncbi:hypothetical protein F8M41_021689 [Gigaspora margarita]|uniref:Uncharacterized protein n=1 Tax=Gigaspora margarita TaxID=4874 RepID=A0A8H4EIW2_GIGMA|nr:hypothetical protein F8M41_021689 [Gigaspora margarita]
MKKKNIYIRNGIIFRGDEADYEKAEKEVDDIKTAFKNISTDSSNSNDPDSSNGPNKDIKDNNNKDKDNKDKDNKDKDNKDKDYKDKDNKDKDNKDIDSDDSDDSDLEFSACNGEKDGLKNLEDEDVIIKL